MTSRCWSNQARHLACALAVCGMAGMAHAAPAPCTLLTQAQVSAALGVAFGPAEPIGTKGCSWTSEKPHEIVTLSLWPPAEWDRIKASSVSGTKKMFFNDTATTEIYTTVAQY